MTHTFLHMGCNQEIARRIVNALNQGAEEIVLKIADSQYAGLKLEAENDTAHLQYFREYYWQTRLQQEQALMDVLDAEEGKELHE